MKWLKRSALAGVLALASILGTALTTLPAGAKATIPQTCGAWSVVPSPTVGSGERRLYGVAAVSATNVWAVGDSINTSNTTQTLIEHWNGSSWQVVPSPNVGSGDNSLTGVAAVSATNIWAVGQYVSSTFGDDQSLIEHWNGTSWSVFPSASPKGAGFSGVAAVSATNIWAVGTVPTYSGIDQTWVQHITGTSAQFVPSPDVGPLNDNELYGVAAVSATNVWAVGAYFNSSANATQTLIEQWNGSSWNVVSSPNVGSANILSSVARVPGTSQLWAVGNSYPFGGNAFQTLIEQWNGTSWSVVSSPNVGTGLNRLEGVAAISASNAWAVGYADSSATQTLIEHWNGASWSIVPSPNVGAGDFLYGVARIPGASQVWAVGYYANSSNNSSQTLTEFYC